MIRLRHMMHMGPSPTEIDGLDAGAAVTFAPMDALADGLGGLDASRVRPLSEVERGSYNYFREGDILLAKVTPCFENGKKAIANGLSNGVGFATSEVHVLRPDSCKIDVRFLHYLLCSEDFRANCMKSMTGAGGLRRVSEKAILDWRPKITQLDAQGSIADFLDRETARIDRLIEKKQALVSSLWERREASTRGLLSGENCYAQQRMSTLAPWLQSVPCHWEVMPLRRLVRISTGVRDTQDRTDDGAYPFYVRSMTVERIGTYSYNEEAVLTSGDGAGVGKVFHHVHRKFELHQRMYAFTRFKKISGRYFYHFLKTFFHLQMTQWSAKSTVDSVRMPFLKSMLFAIPQRDEQEALLVQIDASLGRTTQAVKGIEQSIDRLKEYRSALITAAVTGQIDVTTWRKQGCTERHLNHVGEEISA